MQTVYRVYEGTREPHRLGRRAHGRGARPRRPGLDPDRDRLRCRRGSQRLLGRRAPRYKRIPIVAARSAGCRQWRRGPCARYRLPPHLYPQAAQAHPNGRLAGCKCRSTRPLWRGYPGRCPRTCATMLAGSPDYRGQGGLPACRPLCVLPTTPWHFALRLCRGQALIRACGSPLACTSANTHGAPAPASFATVEERILEGVDVAVDAGETPCRDASTIVSFQHGGLQILQPRQHFPHQRSNGPVRPDAIERCKRCR